MVLLPFSRRACLPDHGGVATLIRTHAAASALSIYIRPCRPNRPSRRAQRARKYFVESIIEVGPEALLSGAACGMITFLAGEKIFGWQNLPLFSQRSRPTGRCATDRKSTRLNSSHQII